MNFVTNGHDVKTNFILMPHFSEGAAKPMINSKVALRNILSMGVSTVPAVLQVAMIRLRLTSKSTYAT